MNTVEIRHEQAIIAITERGCTAEVHAPITKLATIVAQGPQGPLGPPGAGGIVVDESAKVDKSIVYYDAGSATFKADSTWTIATIVDGANF